MKQREREHFSISEIVTHFWQLPVFLICSSLASLDNDNNNGRKSQWKRTVKTVQTETTITRQRLLSLKGENSRPIMSGRTRWKNTIFSRKCSLQIRTGTSNVYFIDVKWVKTSKRGWQTNSKKFVNRKKANRQTNNIAILDTVFQEIFLAVLFSSCCRLDPFPRFSVGFTVLNFFLLLTFSPNRFLIPFFSRKRILFGRLFCSMIIVGAVCAQSKTKSSLQSRESALGRLKSVKEADGCFGRKQWEKQSENFAFPLMFNILAFNLIHVSIGSFLLIPVSPLFHFVILSFLYKLLGVIGNRYNTNSGHFSLFDSHTWISA